MKMNHNMTYETKLNVHQQLRPLFSIVDCPATMLVRLTVWVYHRGRYICWSRTNKFREEGFK